MILRKTPSAFLRTLRSIPADKLPTLPAEKLSARRQKRLEDAVFARIANEQTRTIFDAEPIQSHTSTDDDAYVTYDSSFEMTVIEPGAWKRNLRRSLASVLAACLCFAVLAAAVLYRHDIALYFAEHSHLVDTVEPGQVETQATDDLPETGVAPPFENAEGLRLDVIEIDTTYTGRTSLSVRLTSDDPLEGISVQYSRVILTKWNSDTEQYETLYDVYTSPQPKLDILAGVLDFPLIGLGKTNTVEADITVSRDLRGQTGIYYLVLEGLTLVRDSDDPGSGDYETALIAQTLTDSTVLGSFVIYPTVIETMPVETLPPRDTVTPPPDSASVPHDASNLSTLVLSDTKIDGNNVTLHLALNVPNIDPDGVAVYYRIEETELWNEEKQVWEGKHGTDLSGDDTYFAKMVMAGDLHFEIDGVADSIFDTPYSVFGKISMILPDDGWYRITLRGLVLVRDAKEGEEAQWNLVTESLDEGAVYALFYKE